MTLTAKECNKVELITSLINTLSIILFLKKSNTQNPGNLREANQEDYKEVVDSNFKGTLGKF